MLGSDPSGDPAVSHRHNDKLISLYSHQLRSRYFYPVNNHLSQGNRVNIIGAGLPPCSCRPMPLSGVFGAGSICRMHGATGSLLLAGLWQNWPERFRFHFGSHPGGR